MDCNVIIEAIEKYTSDAYLFPLSQIFLIGFVFYAINKLRKQSSKPSEGGVSFTVERGRESMLIFYGMYGAITGVYLGIALSTKVIENHKVLFAFLDTAAIAYVCLSNNWFRNKLVSWSNKLKKENS